MKTFFREYHRAKRLFITLLLSFAAVFLLRLGYEVYFTNHDIVISYDYPDYSNHAYPEGEDSYSRVSTKNIATDKISQKDYAGQEIMIDQKYEKSADMSAMTADFQKDNQNLRNIIIQHDAVIQAENLAGLEGRQRLTMSIGVMPEKFDGIVEQIKSIGTLQSFTVNKVDKTAEFKTLLAEQETLVKTRESYITIKEKGGNIQDLLLLEDKILEVEKNLQNLGVSIGTYSTENSFCTINVSLNENAGAVRETSLKFVLKCAKRSFLWTIGVFVLLVVLTLSALFVIVLFLKLTASMKKAAAAAKTDSGSHEQKDEIQDE